MISIGDTYPYYITIKTEQVEEFVTVHGVAEPVYHEYGTLLMGGSIYTFWLIERATWWWGAKTIGGSTSITIRTIPILSKKSQNLSN